MKILLIGSGGREHALAWKMSQNEKVTHIYVAPGNDGILTTPKCNVVDLHTNDEFLNFAKKEKINLTIVGPEQPLVDGIVDLFQKNKLNIFGPNQKAAQLEGSKIFAKKFMKKYRVATASYASFSNVALAQKYLQRCRYPVVIKADGLAAGKGVEICNDLVTASAIIQRFMVESIFKQAGMKIVIEEFLEGIEASIICVVDNNTIVPLITAQDHKTIFENNQGPNTGGMGVIAPNTHVSKETMEDFTNNIMQKTFVGLKSEKFNFHGFLFFGVMITKGGCKLLEYNVRMGDPECQSIIPLMDFDLTDMFASALQNKLNKFLFNWKQGTAVNVVLASRGYPGNYPIGSIITVKQNPLIFYSGVKVINKHLCTNGGRVLSVVGIGNNPDMARKQAYKNVTLVDFKNQYYRKDIGNH